MWSFVTVEAEWQSMIFIDERGRVRAEPSDPKVELGIF